MKAKLLGIVLALGTASLWAQTPATNPAPAPPPPMHRMHHDMMAQHMRQMQAQVDQMRATLEQMKANLAKITDPAVKQQSQYNVDMWETMVHHMEMMTRAMAPHSDMGHGMGMGSGMGMGGMQSGQSSGSQTPAQPQK